MKSSMAAVVMPAALLGGVAARADITPLQQVISMLDGLQAKGKQDKHEEEVAFANFQQWCDSTRDETKASIGRAADRIEVLKADIEKAEADAAQLAEDVAALQATVASNENEVASATNIRDKELAEFEATHKDLSESIDAIERAISVLKTTGADVPQSLLQLQASPKIPAKAKAVIMAFLQSQASSGESAPPEANAYEFQSGGIVSMLENLRLKFQDERTVLEKEEMNAKANYEVLMQKLADDIKYDNGVIAKKTATRASRLEAAAVAEQELSITEAGKAGDETKLSDALAECATKSTEFENDQKTRAAEIVAIQQATEILRSGAVTGNADTYLPTFIQLRRGATALSQLRGENVDQKAAAQRVVAFLQGEARKTGSKYLALVAQHMQSDPFVKVKKMIKDLIVKLMEQANAEAEGKAFCDTQLGTNKLTRENKQAEVAELTADLEQKQAESSQLSQEISELADGIASIMAEQNEATQLRAAEKVRNARSVADARDAQTAVQKATQILKEFYGSAAGGSLLQQTGGSEESISAEMAAVQRAPYQGMQSSSTGVLGLLEVVLSDFARLEAETSSAEDTAQDAYDKFMAESTQDKEVKETTKSHKEGNRAQADALASHLKKELDLTQQELDAAVAYYENLKPTCVDNDLSYEERVAAREAELQSLKEALAMLQQQDLA